MARLADELKEKMKKVGVGQSKSKTKSKEDTSKKPRGVLDLDKQIEEASAKITKKDVEKETKELKSKIKTKTKSEGETLIPLEDYIKCAVHLGTKVITPHMRKYVYKRRADGLAVINTVEIDDKLRKAIEFVIKYTPEQIYLVCKREAGWEAARKFEQATNIKAFTKKYPPGITTNLEFEDFFEKELTIICDPWIDKNALVDTARLKKPVLSLCDTNNFTTNVTELIPCNNKSTKSIGCILFILAREYNKAKKIPFDYVLEDFTGPLE